MNFLHFEIVEWHFFVELGHDCSTALSFFFLAETGCDCSTAFSSRLLAINNP